LRLLFTGSAGVSPATERRRREQFCASNDAFADETSAIPVSKSL
jgi:hypothetical protein